MQRLPRPQPVAIERQAGRIEALLEEPEGSRPAQFGVICHPHPLHGGTMHNKVVHTLARALHDLGVPTLRFNYRGVGASEGRYDGGVGETDDALAVTEWGRQRWPEAAPWLLGFSFGGAVAMRAGARAGARLLVTVAPAVGRDAEVDALPACPWLLIQGDADEIIDAREVLDWVSRRASSLGAQAPVVRVLPGAGHFFHGRLQELRDNVVAFVKESGAQPAG